MSLFRPSRGRSGVLPALIGDLVVFLAFSFFGRAEHNMDLHLMGTLMTAGPFIVTWLIIGTFQGVYAPQTLRHPGVAAKRTVVAWLFAGPWALLFRSLLLQSPAVLVQFAVITLLFNLVALTVWRVVYAAWLRR